MKIRLYNCRILAMDSGLELRPGEVWIQDDAILLAGTPEQQITDWDREINLDGDLVMPGFKNAHTHSGMTLLRSYADDLPLQQWLNDKIFPVEEKLTQEDILNSCKLAIMEYLTSGITSAADMYLAPDMMAQASRECGFRTVLVGAVNDFTHSVEELEQWYKKYNRENDLISFQLGFHAEYTTSRGILEGVAALAKKFRAPVYSHSSETRSEVQGCIERNQKTPTAYLDSLGIYHYGGGGYHCVHMTEEDYDIYKQRQLTAVTNPASNIKLASGIAPLSEFQKRGIPVAVGTDGAASNNSLDIFREMYLAAGLSKLREQNPAAMDGTAVLQMAVQGGAAAMGLSNCDSLAAGKAADLTVIDLHQPNMQPLNHILKNLVYSGSKSNVRMTMVAGKILYMDGEFFIGTEPEEIYEQVNRAISRIKV